MNAPHHFSRRRVLGADAALAGAAALPTSPAFAAETRSVRIGFQKGGLLLLS